MSARCPPRERPVSVLVLALALSAAPCVGVAQSSDLAGRVAKLEQTLSNRGLLDLLQEIDSLKREIAGLRGELENQAFALEQLRKSQAATYNDLDQRLRVLPGAGQGTAQTPALPVLAPPAADAVAGTPASQGDLQVQTETSRPAAVATDAPASPAVDPVTGLAVAPPPGPTSDPGQGMLPAPGQMAVQPLPPGMQETPAPVSTPDAPVAPMQAPITTDDAASETAYRDAFALLKSGEYDRAIAAFETFQQQFPNSQYGDNAQFWLAEAFYVKRDFTAALPAYQKMLSQYPASKKLSHAMLKIGYSHAELGQNDEARASLTELVQRFPGSAAAQLAEQRIAQLPAR
ncbi:MAG: tol-pal system protein YbgF [Gammaproteobacteria bacterium]